MIEARLPADLYPRSALERAAAAYAEFANVEIEAEAEAWIVRISATGAADERQLADELFNYALGATIEGRTP